MIKYDDILEEVNSKELDQIEKGVLQKIEDYTDESIREQFKKGYSVDVGSKTIDSLIASIPYRRQLVIKDLWRKMYENNGWKIDYSSDDSVFTFSSKK